MADELLAPPSNNQPAETVSPAISKISDAPPSQQSAKVVGELEEIAFEETIANEERLIDFQRKRLENEAVGQDIGERKKYASRLFWLVAGWVAVVFLILLLQGFLSDGISFDFFGKRLSWKFKLSDNVLLAVLGTTTVTIVGLFTAVNKYLFPNRDKKLTGE